MPLQNRVNPEGEICFSPARGNFMGNRGGCMHNDKMELVYAPKSKGAWITCLLEFKDRKRELMSPGLYTELFFLDEATALAAGHRPCAECRRPDYKKFTAAWGASNRPGEAVKAPDVDAQLRLDRSAEGRQSVNNLSGLPDGVIVKQTSSGAFFLIRASKLYPWSFEGYGPAQTLAAIKGPFIILTPASTVKALQNGYTAEIHRSAT